MQGMKFLTTTLATVILLMTGCAQNNETESIYLPLSFSTAVDAQTRVTDFTTDNLTSMGVFACFSQGNFNASTATPDFMYNQIVERTDAAAPWTYSPVKYWPNNVKDKISFFAYAPHNGKMITDALTMSGITDKGYPSLTFTNKTAQTDFLLADPLINKDNTENSIKFNFKHALAKVSFYVKNGDATSGKKVHSFAVHSRQSGKYTFNGTGFVYTSANTTMREDAIINTPVDIPQNTTDKVLLETLFIHPDTETNISLTYSINGNDANKVEIANQKVPATPALASGANINYIITVNKDNYTITASNEKEWAQGSENKITYYEAKDLKIGDYYYSDGSTSDGGVRGVNKATGEITLENPLPGTVLTNPETGTARTCVGLVFYVGKHPTDDSTYPDAMNGEVKGYVLSITDYGWYNGIQGNTTRWASSSYFYLINTSHDTEDYKGYFNTLQIKNTATSNGQWDDIDSFSLVYKLLTRYTSPDVSSINCSGWYMPSIGQLLDIDKYKVALRKILAKAGNYTLNGVGNPGGRYWSSTEKDARNAWIVKDIVTNKGVKELLLKDYRYGTRPVLTF